MMAKYMEELKEELLKLKHGEHYQHYEDLEIWLINDVYFVFELRDDWILYAYHFPIKMIDDLINTVEMWT